MSAKQLQAIVTAVVNSIPELTHEEARIVLGTPGTLAQGVTAAFEPFKKNQQTISVLPVVKRIYKIRVPYHGSKTIENLLKMGKYDWENTDVTDMHFPNSRQGIEQIRVRLVHFNRVISSEVILAELKKKSFRPANAAELLSLGAAQPDLQRQFPIIALGQAWRFSSSDAFVTCLAWHGMLRRMRPSKNSLFMLI